MQTQPAPAASTLDDEVLYDVRDGIATLTLNRPERLNTISREMLMLLGQLLLRADADPAVRVVILTGAGRAFCAGLDMTAATKGSGIGSQNDRNATVATLDLKTAPPTILFNMEKPTICALNGAAAGYGMDMALGCDIRIMAEGAKFAAAFVKRGVVPESGGTWFLPRMIGWAKAAELIFTGRTLSAAESLDMGLANEVVATGDVMSRANAVAAEIAGNARQTSVETPAMISFLRPVASIALATWASSSELTTVREITGTPGRASVNSGMIDPQI